jgi:predicted SprT family Zn-dependent metalloprotease
MVNNSTNCIAQQPIPGNKKHPADPRASKIVVSDTSLGQASARTLLGHATVSSDAGLEQRRRFLFRLQRQDIAISFLAELDKKITSGQISQLTASTGGVKIVWSRRLQTTAGQAKLKRKLYKDELSSRVQCYNDATIELADKIVTDRSRLYNVMAHEFCHLANFLVSRVTTDPHGKDFEKWGAMCTKIFKHRGVKVQTTHSYT